VATLICIALHADKSAAVNRKHRCILVDIGLMLVEQLYFGLFSEASAENDKTIAHRKD
jgi:hypothetical protein